MQHIYISQGKKYISAKRASKISDYSSDYVGQLCRGGKLDCQRVGHTWFVTEESLREHMAKVWSNDAMRNRADNLKRRKIEKKDDQRADLMERISSKQAALFSGYSSDYIGQLSRTKKIDAVMMGKTWFVTESSLKAHMEKIRQEEEAKKVRDAQENALRIESLRLEQNAKEVRAEKPTKILTGARARSVYFSRPAVVASLTFCALAVVVVFIAGNLGSIMSTSRNLAAGLSYNVAPSAQSVVPSVSSGLAVAPATGSASGDQAVQDSIKTSFSDEVDVTPSSDGSSGVIKPVFRKNDGKDFLYVMVPVKQASTTAK